MLADGLTANVPRLREVVFGVAAGHAAGATPESVTFERVHGGVTNTIFRADFADGCGGQWGDRRGGEGGAGRVIVTCFKDARSSRLERCL